MNRAGIHTGECHLVSQETRAEQEDDQFNNEKGDGQGECDDESRC